MHLKMSSAKWRPVSLGLNVLISLSSFIPVVYSGTPIYHTAPHGILHVPSDVKHYGIFWWIRADVEQVIYRMSSP